MASCQLPAAEVENEATIFISQHPNTSKMLQFENRTLHYVVTGDKQKQPLVFVHGSPGSWGGWIRFLNDPDLKTNFLLIAVDRPGYGGSGKGVSEPSLNKQAQALQMILEKENVKNPILIGHSLGGALIARMAMNNPKAIAGLIFIAASVSPDLEKIKWFQYPAQWAGIKQIIPTDLRVCNEEILPFKEELIEMLPLWPMIQSQVAIIHGQEDNLVPPMNVDFLVQKISPEFMGIVMREPKLNHFVPWRRPDLVKLAITHVYERIKTK